MGMLTGLLVIVAIGIVASYLIFSIIRAVLAR
jgi:hypothetical protein